MCVYIECNSVNNKPRYLCIYANDKLSDYFISAVPQSIDDERADKLISYIEKERTKLSGQELLRFNAKIKYVKKIPIGDKA